MFRRLSKAIQRRRMVSPRSGAARALAMLILAATAAGCGASTTTSRTAPSPPASSSGRVTPLAGAVHLVFMDTATSTRCPSRTPAKDDCFRLTAAANVAGHGTVRLGPTLDIEAPSGTRQCGAATTFTTRLTTAQGTLRVIEGGPRLCLGALATVTRKFRIAGGSGRYAHATGSGTAVINVLPVGASETWSGQIALH